METKGKERDVRKRIYFWLMGTCLALICISWLVVRHFSVSLAAALSLVAALLPPVAVVVANWGRHRHWDW